MHLVLITVAALSQSPALPADHMAPGVEPRELYRGKRLVAKGLESIETFSGTEHFFSHAETSSAVTEVDAWTNDQGVPLTAKYLLTNGSGWVLVQVQIQAQAGRIVMTRTSSNENIPSTSTFSVPSGRLVTLAQFDPLKLCSGRNSTGSQPLSLIDAEHMTIVDASLEEKESSGSTRIFDLVSGSGTSELSVSSDGHFVQMVDSNGQSFVPAAWNRDYLDMAARAGIRVDPAIRARVLADSMLSHRRGGR